ncbi:GDYXXLXY domain-containing protein [Chryseolinea sp. T2]|uniref:GDYXXLXY domain-containing protein n=1 Tax=Chryseolinea sp. T2 TaxID=3129255 RepID=UPI0030780023
MRGLIVGLFIVMCIAQLAVPGKMIWDRENIVSSGTPYKFRTQPIDPSDPFRGKYITLNFLADYGYDTGEWSSGESVNVVFETDSAGYAKVNRLTRDEPDGPYLRTTIYYIDSDSIVHFTIPFDRFYMEESKALPAEQYYNQSTRDSASVCYGLVRIGRGQAVITDVFINERSIVDLVRGANDGN